PGAPLETVAERGEAAALPEHDPPDGNEDPRQLPPQEPAPRPAGPPSDRSQPRRDQAVPPARRDDRSRTGPNTRRDRHVEGAEPVPDRSGPVQSDPTRRGAASSGYAAEWPSVQDILASHRPGSCLHPAAISGRGPLGQAMPTEPRAPGVWVLPLW